MSSTDVLQLAFLIDRSLLSMSYRRNTQGKSGIVDFRYKDIQNLEEIEVLPGFRGKTGQINRPVRHPKPRPEVL
jgi:hypothetical protein